MAVKASQSEAKVNQGLMRMVKQEDRQAGLEAVVVTLGEIRATLVVQAVTEVVVAGVLSGGLIPNLHKVVMGVIKMLSQKMIMVIIRLLKQHKRKLKCAANVVSLLALVIKSLMTHRIFN